jgi:hypothetical protein
MASGQIEKAVDSACDLTTHIGVLRGSHVFMLERFNRELHDLNDLKEILELRNQVCELSKNECQEMSRDQFFYHVAEKYGIDTVTAFEMYKDGCRFLK